MKVSRNSLAIIAAAAFLAGPTTYAQTDKTNARSSYAGLISASKLKDAEVYNLQNEEIGEVEEVLIDPASGRIRFAVVGVGGFLEIGETEVAVPWSAFHISKEGNEVKYVLDASKEKLEKAPRVSGKAYDRLYEQKDAEPSYVYWGVTWYDLGPLVSPSPGASPSPGKSSSSATMASPSPSPKKMTTPSMSPSPATTGSKAMSPSPSPRKY